MLSSALNGDPIAPPQARASEGWSRPAEPARWAGAHVLSLNRVGFMGGVERLILTAAEATGRLGWRTVLACPDGALAQEASRRGLQVRPLDIAQLSTGALLQTPGALFGAVRQVRRSGEGILRLAAQEGAGILHVHHPAVVLQALRTQRVLRRPMIWHVHETAPAPFLYRAAAAVALPRCAQFIGVSKASCDMLVELGAPRELVRLIYNAVEPRFFQRGGPSPDIAGDGPHIGAFGVLEPRKGHPDLICAVAELVERWPTLHLWIVGGLSRPEHAGYLSRLRQLIAELGLCDRVTLLGARHDVPALMRAMDAVVLASTASESLPTVLLEACAIGAPALSTDVGGVREVLRDGLTGRIVPPNAPRRLAEALCHLLSPAGRLMARQAQLEARERFSPERFARDLTDAYGALLDPAGEA